MEINYATMIPVEEAKNLIVSHTTPLPKEKLALLQANGRVLAEGIIAPFSIPAYPQSSMDGYALHFDGSRFPKKLVGEMAAGSNKEFTLKPDEAIRIFTGAAVPAGANTVLMQEKARVEEGYLYMEDANLSAGANVRSVGSEIARGDLALPAGAMLTPAAIGFLAGIGITEVSVFPLPKVSIIVTGNELQTPGEPLAYGQVYEANSFTLVSALGQSGIHPLGLYRGHDDPDQLSEILMNALEGSDVVLMTGGVSVGDYDFTTQAFDACGVQKVFHKIKQKPGKPILFGVKEDKLVFGLPGNPASVLTCYYQYVLPAFSVMTDANLNLPVKHVPLITGIKKPAGLTHFLKGYFDGERVELLGGQESYKLNSFAKANCLAEIAEETIALQEGDAIKIHLFA
jgi:molybdopterin molybdotransferase